MKRNRAFTLIELILVIAIIALMAAIAVPNLTSATNRTLMRSTAYALAQELNYAQQQAVITNSMVNFTFDHTDNSFRIEKAVDGTVLKTGSFDTRVSVSAKLFESAGDADHTLVRYTNTGSAHQSGAFYTQTDAGFLQVRVSGVTGKALVEEP